MLILKHGKIPFLNSIIIVLDALMKYILVCCRFLVGGLLDKPGR